VDSLWQSDNPRHDPTSTKSKNFLVLTTCPKNQSKYPSLSSFWDVATHQDRYLMRRELLNSVACLVYNYTILHQSLSYPSRCKMMQWVSGRVSE
jgi:hypothetical protein